MHSFLLIKYFRSVARTFANIQRAFELQDLKKDLKKSFDGKGKNKKKVVSMVDRYTAAARKNSEY